MTFNEVIDLLRSNQNERGIQQWNKQSARPDRLKSFGIGLTVLRKLAKKIGRNHALAKQLWESDIYDVKIMALLIDDPKQISRDQVELQVDNMNQGHLAHVFSSCDAALSKTPFVVELLSDWINKEDSMRKGCGYGLLYEVSKSKKKNAPDDAFFLEKIKQINDDFDQEKNSVQVAMGGALMGMGKRNKTLNRAALKVAQRIGPIPIETGVSKCEPFDVVKHLTSDYLKKKFDL
ncbi:MAG: DNA alkylation repair protein [Saprospiraceae bacterium]|nr:DNA alkylation repair protein [Saprospiraceae bacterium]